MMNFYSYNLIEKFEDNPGVWIYRFAPHEETTVFPFLPGQYVFIKNPKYKPEEEHPFSIASSPTKIKYLEFCIKNYGDWTEEFAKLEQGDEVRISDPQGSFVWDPTVNYAVFLLGGIGISPIMSMLRYLNDSNKKVPITLLYGNRTLATISYKQDLEEMLKFNPPLSIIHILSHLTDDDPWTGYRGFITKEIIEKEVDFNQHPTFFIIGPPVFTDLMNNILADFDLQPDQSKFEQLEEKTKTFIIQK